MTWGLLAARGIMSTLIPGGHRRRVSSSGGGQAEDMGPRTEGCPAHPVHPRLDPLAIEQAVPCSLRRPNRVPGTLT
jgi:hypothetical protein